TKAYRPATDLIIYETHLAQKPVLGFGPVAGEAAVAALPLGAPGVANRVTELPERRFSPARPTPALG
ncbi:MAG: hypothetical protein WKG07_22440, partial [Hymenobacter sp.]